MNTFKMKSLYAALASVGALGAVGTAQAANVNPDGLGQVLIYPYYTVQSVTGPAGTAAPYNSLLSVVNTTTSAKAVKVRFVEGRNSREVLDFNLFLSHNDVWTAAVIPLGTGLLDGAGIYTRDNSCTLPSVPVTAATAQPFVNFAYAGDGAGDTLDRTREGYIEIIEMGVVTGATALAVTHDSTGKPACTAAALADSVVAANIVAPTGGLFGGVSLINVLAGVDVPENAVAIDNFRSAGVYNVPGSILPDLSQVNPPTAVLFAGATGVVQATGFLQNIDAISALFMVNHVYNEYVLDLVTKSGTDWVLTMPTKRYYFDADGVVSYLFQRNFTTNSCDDIGLIVFDREEQTPTTPQGFSPPPPPGKVAGLCYEANVLTFNGTNVLGSANSLSATVKYQDGYADLVLSTPTSQDFVVGGSIGPAHTLGATAVTKTSPAGVVTPAAAGTFFGLPIIGFAVQSFTNGTLSAPTATPTATTTSLVQANYAGAFNHRVTRSILP